MDFSERVMLGRTGLKVGRLGISSSYGAPAQAFEEAYERGCNYFTWGTFIKGRSSEMREAIRNIVKKGGSERGDVHKIITFRDQCLVKELRTATCHAKPAFMRRVETRGLFSYWAVREPGLSATGLARDLRLSQPAVSMLPRQEERITKANSFELREEQNL